MGPRQKALNRAPMRAQTAAPLIVFETTTLLFYLIVVQRILAVRGKAWVIPALAFPATIWTIGYGQNAFLTAALLGAGTLLLDGRPAVAGVLLGMLCYKPHFALLVPVALLAGRRWLAIRGMRTLALRMARHNTNGMAVAEWAETHPAIAKVHYPGLPSHPDHEHAKAVLGGYGGMVGLELAGGPKAAERLLKRVKLVTHAPSLAGVETLVSEPRLTSHASLTAEQRAQAGIPDGFLRFSLGLEDPDDLIADFAQALARH